jgi:divinyl protochlorophyllide a 8-vinyl-reductase
MVDERLFAALSRALLRELGQQEARLILAEAGTATGRYVLANRIPRLAKGGLRILPRPLRLRALMKAIASHAWTFTGSGRFRHRPTPGGAEFTLDPSLVCTVAGRATEPMGSYYAGAFRTLIRSLVDPRASVEETECTCCGGDLCRFRVVLSPPSEPAPFEHLPE